MADATRAFLSARRDEGSAQERNRAWWEALPMTYVEWSEEDREIPSAHSVRNGETRDLYAANPFLRPKHFTHPGKAVLEIGCGAGGATQLFRNHSAKVTAIDLTEKAVEMTTRGAPEATVLQMDCEEMTFPDAAFDHVFSWGVIHHTAHTERAVEQIARVLKPSGTGLLMVYNKSSLRYWGKGIHWLYLKKPTAKDETLDSIQRHFTDGYFHRHFTPGEFRALLQANGLKVTAMHKTHMAKPMVPKIPRALDNWLKRRWGWLLVAEIEKVA